MKAVARVPSSLRDCASFSPDMGFVQPGSFFEFGLRFRPDVESLLRCAQDGWGMISPPPSPPQSEESHDANTRRNSDGIAKKLQSLGEEGPDRLCSGNGQQESHHDGEQEQRRGEPSNDGNKGVSRAGAALAAVGAGDDPPLAACGVIVIPLKFDVPGQALPARSVLQARLTGCNVELGFGDGGENSGGGKGGRSGLCFGPCFVGQSVRRRVSLRSTSLLPAKFGFVGNPVEVGNAERGTAGSLRSEVLPAISKTRARPLIAALVEFLRVYGSETVRLDRACYQFVASTESTRAEVQTSSGGRMETAPDCPY